MLLLMPSAVLAAKTSMPPGSFLTKPVATVADLAAVVRNDKLVGQRYSKHFGMQPEVLARYFEENLSVSSLSKKTTYTVYFIAKDGRIVSHRKTLRAGTKVFVNWNGEPVIDVKCGNPLTKTLVAKPVVKIDVPIIQIAEPVVELLPSTPEETKLEQPVAEPVQITQEEPKMMVAAEPPTELTSPVTRVAPLQYLLVPGLLGAVGLLGGGGGGGGEPIPEPSSLLVLGFTCMGVLVRCFKRR
jgi:hypothetical protein